MPIDPTPAQSQGPADLYGPQHQALQRDFGTGPLAERVHLAIVRDELDAQHQGFIASRDFFFLSTVDHRGFPTCSHKGGPVGFVRTLDTRTLAFPSYDGNGMYLSMGNLGLNDKVGLLFIDFQTPHRVRVHGRARIDRADPLLADFPGAELVVRVAVSEVFVNCPRYIHRAQPAAASKYVPAADGSAPMPQWKRIDAIQDALPARDQAARERSGESTISMDEYGERLMRGEG